MLKKILFFLFMPALCLSQNHYFEKVYGTGANDVSRSVKQLPGGSIFVLGNSDFNGQQDISLSKLNGQGDEVWTIYYGTANVENAFYLNLTDDGNLIFVAETETASNNLDILIYKVDTAGAVIWNKTFASPVNENAKYIEQTNDNGYILCGAQNDSSGFYDILAVKLDSAGDEDWHVTLGRTQNDYSDMIHETGTEYILTGDTRSYGAGGYDIILYKLDSAGNELWSQTYGDTLQNGCQGVLVLSDGNYLSYGETEIYPASPFNFYLEKIDPSGGSLWRYTYGGTGADAIFSVKEDTDGGFICTGYSNSYNGGGPLDLVILKADASGIFLWKETYGGAGIDIGYELIPSVDNNGYIITGKTFQGSEQYYLLKLNSSGLAGISPSEKTKFDNLAYPNPSLKEISFKTDEKTNAPVVIIITDVSGKVIKEVNVVTDDERLITADISQLAKGLYFCTAFSEGILIGRAKFIKL
jgi:hypothetical protein